MGKLAKGKEEIIEAPEKDLKGNAGYKQGMKRVENKPWAEPFIDTLGHGALDSGVEALVTDQCASSARPARPSPPALPPATRSSLTPPLLLRPPGGRC